MLDETPLAWATMSLHELLDLLQKASVGSTAGEDQVNRLKCLISVRTAEMVSGKLAQTSESIGKSANTIKEALVHAESIGKATIKNSSNYLINAIKVETESAANNAKQIETEIAKLTSALHSVAGDLRDAGAQNSKAASRLSNFTLLLGIGTSLLFLAACWQAWEAHRQVGVISRQLQFAERQAAAASSPPSATRNR